MATGSGKTTVMGMLAAWSILNKVANRSDARFSDIVLVVCPNVTIKNRLGELNPKLGEASLYRTRDLVPERLMPDLARASVLVLELAPIRAAGSNDRRRVGQSVQGWSRGADKGNNPHRAEDDDAARVALHHAERSQDPGRGGHPDCQERSPGQGRVSQGS